MNVTVFGAGGRTGREVVAQAVAAGHAVTAVVRRPPDPPLDPAVRIVSGDARDGRAVASALDGADAVLSAMGPGGDDPGTSYSEGIVCVVGAMETSGPSRLVITANARVFDDRPLAGPYAGISEEHRRAVAIVRESGLAWTVLATPMLTDDVPAGSYSASMDAKGEGADIDRGDFARALVDALSHEGWLEHVIGVTR